MHYQRHLAAGKMIPNTLIPQILNLQNNDKNKAKSQQQKSTQQINRKIRIAASVFNPNYQLQPLPQEQQEQPPQHIIEIERRFQQSQMKNYVFPRKRENLRFERTISDDTSELNELKSAGMYDLNEQNKLKPQGKLSSFNNQIRTEGDEPMKKKFNITKQKSDQKNNYQNYKNQMKLSVLNSNKKSILGSNFSIDVKKNIPSIGRVKTQQDDLEDSIKGPFDFQVKPNAINDKYSTRPFHSINRLNQTINYRVQNPNQNKQFKAGSPYIIKKQ